MLNLVSLGRFKGPLRIRPVILSSLRSKCMPILSPVHTGDKVEATYVASTGNFYKVECYKVACKSNNVASTHFVALLPLASIDVIETICAIS